MKKLLLTTTAVLALTFGVLMNYQPKIDANFDELGIQQELTNHRERLDNHEDRITNTEADVKVIQEKTATPPATERVIIREAVTQPAEKTKPVAEAQSEPEPIVVVTATKRVEGEGPIFYYCDLTYSDGTKKSLLVAESSSSNVIPSHNCDSYIGKT